MFSSPQILRQQSAVRVFPQTSRQLAASRWVLCGGAIFILARVITIARPAIREEWCRCRVTVTSACPILLIGFFSSLWTPATVVSVEPLVLTLQCSSSCTAQNCFLLRHYAASNPPLHYKDKIKCHISAKKQILEINCIFSLQSSWI